MPARGECGQGYIGRDGYDEAATRERIVSRKAQARRATRNYFKRVLEWALPWKGYMAANEGYQRPMFTCYSQTNHVDARPKILISLCGAY